VSISATKPKSTKLSASAHMLRLQSSYWRSASSRGVPMNQTAPLTIIWFTSSPLTAAARGSRRAASDVTVDFPAPGIPDTITQPESSSVLMRGDAFQCGAGTTSGFRAVA
jgi:hypothetical protein